MIRPDHLCKGLLAHNLIPETDIGDQTVDRSCNEQSSTLPTNGSLNLQTGIADKAPADPPDALS